MVWGYYIVWVGVVDFGDGVDKGSEKRNEWLVVGECGGRENCCDLVFCDIILLCFEKEC